MQLTELLFQRVKDLGGQGSLALKPGYVSVVSRSPSVRAAIVAALFPGPDDQRLLGDGSGSTRVGVGLIGRDGLPYRLLRELGAARHLHKFDAALKKFAPLTDDDLEISSFLRVECELPTPESYSFFVLEPGELPSQRKAGASGATVVDQEKVRALKAELAQTKEFEGAQDKLYNVQTRLHELNELAAKADAAQRELEELEAQAARSLFTPAQMKDLTQRAGRAAAEKQKHAAALDEVAGQVAQLEEETPETPDPLYLDSLLWGGLGAGVAVDVLAFLLKHPIIALGALIPYGAALVAALRWVDAHEAVEEGRVRLSHLKEREGQLKRAFAEEQAPLKAALKAAKVEAPEDLLELFKQRDEALRLRDQAKARLEALRAMPELAQVAAERPALLEEKQVLELTVAAQGFARGVGEIENDLKRELGLIAPEQPKDKKPGAEDGGETRRAVDRACEILGTTAAELWPPLGPRLGSYLTALTDKRIVAGRPDATGALLLQAADGRMGPWATLPQPMKDQSWVALRLALLERVVAVKKLPVVVDDAFASFDPARRALLGKMLKALSAQTQVVHRLPEAPAPGLFDHVVSAA